MPLHGKDTVFLHDQYNLTSSLDSASIDRSIAVLDTTVFGLDSRTYTPGQKDGSISVEGFADPAAAGIDTILTNSFGSASTVVTVSLGQTAGSNAYLMDAIENQYATTSSVTELVRITGEYTAAQDGVDAGVLLLPVTTATASANGATYDRGSGVTTSSGAVAILHVTAVSGTSPTLDMTVQTDDNSSFTSPLSLITFVQSTAITSQRIETALSTQQYVRLNYTIGGTDPSFTFAVSFATR
jgi:hypothetical protein